MQIDLVLVLKFRARTSSVRKLQLSAPLSFYARQHVVRTSYRNPVCLSVCHDPVPNQAQVR